MLKIKSNGRYSVLGSSGSGKSNFVFLLLEDLRNRKQPVIILDKKGEYLDLPGMYHVNPAYEKPKELPFKLRNSNASVVIDLRPLKNPEAWIRDFLNTCMRLARKYPILVVIEEAHTYCPQRGKAISKKAVNKLAAEGRSAGYGFMLISQRCAKLDKNALDESEYLFLLRHNFPKDITYLEGVIGKDKAAENQGLADGQVQVCHLKTLQFDPPEQVPLSTTKKSGHTPAAVSVDVDKEALLRPYRGSSPVGYGPGPGAAADGSGGYGYIIIGVIIIIVVVLLIAYLTWRGMDPDSKKVKEERSDWQEPGPSYTTPR